MTPHEAVKMIAAMRNEPTATIAQAADLADRAVVWMRSVAVERCNQLIGEGITASFCHYTVPCRFHPKGK